MKIILASASPRRRDLLKIITENFEAVSANVDETIPFDISVENAAMYLSRIKAECAAAKYSDSIVIGCDTTVIVDNQILGKPKDKSQCRDYIKLLSGRSHIVITGCTLICGEISESFSVATEVFFRELKDDEIEEYISSDEPYDKAGGYAVQGKAALFIDKINGDYFNVVGLPVSRLNQELIKFYSHIKEL